MTWSSPTTLTRRKLLLMTTWVFFEVGSSHAFSALGGGGGDKSGLGVALDRFQATCPAEFSCIVQFDPSLIDDDSVWAAVYRGNQNQPSVFYRDNFFHAMNAATSMDNVESTTTSSSAASSSGSSSSWANKLQTPLAQEKPVAVARLKASPDYDQTWVIDMLRCALKKENMDKACDGGSEFLEAISVGIDSLLLYHLKVRYDNSYNRQLDNDDIDEDDNVNDTQVPFEGAIRTKATLFSNYILEDRGFSPVETLSKDMATHVSSLENCLQKYAERSVDKNLNMGARERALQIVSVLGQIDRPQHEEDNNDDDVDPWANVKMQL